MEKDDFTQYSKQFARAFPKPIGNNTLESAIKSKHEEKRRMNEAEEVKARKSKVRFLEDSVRPESDDFRDNVVFDQIPQTDNDTNSTDKDDEELNSRIRELLDANSLVEFLECFHEIKKLKESWSETIAVSSMYDVMNDIVDITYYVLVSCCLFV